MTKIEKIIKTTNRKLDAPDEPEGYVYSGDAKEVYVGEVKNGKPHGHGKIEKESIEDVEVIYRYKGEFKEGKFHGKGILEHPETYSSYASKYEGNFVNDVKDGYGVEILFRHGKVGGVGVDAETWWIYITPEVMEDENGEIIRKHWEWERREGQFKNDKLFKGKRINFHGKVEEVDESKIN